MDLTAAAVCNVLTAADLEALTALPGTGAEGCVYAAEEYAYRADFDEKGTIGEHREYRGAQQHHSDAAAALGRLVEKIHAFNAVGQRRTRG